VSSGVVLEDVMVNNVDIGATVLELAGLGNGGGYITDGKSFASQLTSVGRTESGPWSRDRLVFEYWGLGYTMRGPCRNGTTPCPKEAEALEDAPSNSWSGLRIKNSTHDLVYAEYRGGSSTAFPLVPASTNFTYLFDMALDPWQLNNLAANKTYKQLLETLSGELWEVATCTGQDCP